MKPYYVTMPYRTEEVVRIKYLQPCRDNIYWVPSTYQQKANFKLELVIFKSQNIDEN